MLISLQLLQEILTLTSKDCKSCPHKLAMEFKKPTIEEVKVYADSIGWKNFDAEYFYAKQEQAGWLTQVGKQLIPIANWHGTIMIWYLSAKKRGEIKETGKTFKELYNEH